MSEKWNPRLPLFCKCVVCGGDISAPPSIASKPRKGSTIYAHTECIKTRGEEERKK